MHRLLAYLLALAALIAQVGMGALPPGVNCLCIPVAAEDPACCCDDECGEAAPADPACPCHRGCDKCICLPTVDVRTTLHAKVRAAFDHDGDAAAMLFGPPAVVPARPQVVFSVPPRATESPPGLSRARSTRLILYPIPVGAARCGHLARRAITLSRAPP